MTANVKGIPRQNMTPKKIIAGRLAVREEWDDILNEYRAGEHKPVYVVKGSVIVAVVLGNLITVIVLVLIYAIVH